MIKVHLLSSHLLSVLWSNHKVMFDSICQSVKMWAQQSESVISNILCPSELLFNNLCTVDLINSLNQEFSNVYSGKKYTGINGTITHNSKWLTFGPVNVFSFCLLYPVAPFPLNHSWPCIHTTYLQITYLIKSIQLWRPWGWSVNASEEGR